MCNNVLWLRISSLSENCSRLGTDNVRGQISEHIFAPNGDYCLYIPISVRDVNLFFSLAREFNCVTGHFA